MTERPDLEQRAREMLAAEWDNHVDEPNSGRMAEQLRRGRAFGHPQIYAIRAITKALESSLQEQKRKLEEALGDILPSKLCGEGWDLPDDEAVAITITFGKLRKARALLSGAGE